MKFGLYEKIYNKFKERKVKLFNATLKECYAHNLIDNGEIWIDMMLARNSLSHLYDEEESRKIYNEIKNKYIFEIEKLVKFIEYK